MLTRHLIILFVYEEISHLSCGSKAGHPQHVLPLHNQIFLICCIFVKIWLICMLAPPPPRSWHAPLQGILYPSLHLQRNTWVFSTYIKCEAITVIIILCCCKIFSCIAMIMRSKATIKCFFCSSVRLSMLTTKLSFEWALLCHVLIGNDLYFLS